MCPRVRITHALDNLGREEDDVRVDGENIESQNYYDAFLDVVSAVQKIYL